MSTGDNIENRLERIRAKKSAPTWPRKAAIPTAMLVAGMIGGIWVAGVQPSRKAAPPPMETSEVSEFPTNSGLSGFTITENEPALPPNIETRDPKVQQELDRLREALETARAELAAKGGGVDPDALAALRDEIRALQEESKGREQAFDDLNRDNMRLLSELELAEQMAAQGRDAASREAQELAELERRRVEQEMLRAQMEAELASRARSPMVAYRAGGGSSAFMDEGELDDPEARYSAAERFRRGSADKADAIQAQVIGSPSRTVVQGTLIEATLANAISSQLEGNVTATVSYDVWSMDMTNVLIPRGSKLFGRYSSTVDKGQRRIMVAWDRVVTPDGQSATLAAYGTDRVGRSGVTGKVNTHALPRFGAAAAVSIIGALPAVLAAAVEKDGDHEIARDTAARLGGDANNVLGSVMKDYIDIPTTISVDHGAVVMVMVNADLEMF